MISADLGKQLESYIQQLVETGRYGSKSEVLREGVRLIQDRETRLAALDASIMRGIADADANRTKSASDVFDRLEAKYCALADQAEKIGMILEFASEAEHDLEQIADHIAQDNPRRAVSFIQELRSRCEELIDTPNGFALVPRYEHHGIRRRVHGSYLIFYRVENLKVVIVHILHGATDYGAILFGD